MRPPGSLISGIISLFELIKSNTLSVDHWHYNSKLFSFNKNSLTPHCNVSFVIPARFHCPLNNNNFLK